MDDILNIYDKNCRTSIYENNFNKETFIKKLREKYKYILCYHATRLSMSEVNRIKKRGLCMPNLKLFKQKSEKIFLSNIDQNNIETIMETIDIYLSNLKIEHAIFTNLNKNIYKIANQYLVFGSESLIPLAYELNCKFKDTDFLKSMINYGKPYLIKIKLPIDTIDEKYLELIYEYIKNNNLDTDLALLYKENINPSHILTIEEDIQTEKKKHFLASLYR